MGKSHISMVPTSELRRQAYEDELKKTWGRGFWTGVLLTCSLVLIGTLFVGAWQRAVTLEEQSDAITLSR